MGRSNKQAKAQARAASAAAPEAASAADAELDAAEAMGEAAADEEAEEALPVKAEEPTLPAPPPGKARYRTLANCSGILAEGSLTPPGVVLALDDAVAVHYLKQGAIERVL